jgi:hypothetical protein
MIDFKKVCLNIPQKLSLLEEFFGYEIIISDYFDLSDNYESWVMYRILLKLKSNEQYFLLCDSTDSYYGNDCYEYEDSLLGFYELIKSNPEFFTGNPYSLKEVLINTTEIKWIIQGLRTYYYSKNTSNAYLALESDFFGDELNYSTSRFDVLYDILKPYLPLSPYGDIQIEDYTPGIIFPTRCLPYGFLNEKNDLLEACNFLFSV